MKISTVIYYFHSIERLALLLFSNNALFTNLHLPKLKESIQNLHDGECYQIRVALNPHWANVEAYGLNSLLGPVPSIVWVDDVVIIRNLHLLTHWSRHRSWTFSRHALDSFLTQGPFLLILMTWLFEDIHNLVEICKQRAFH